jgi:hypothetical protein
MARHSATKKEDESVEGSETPESPSIPGGAAGVTIAGQVESAAQQVQTMSDDPARNLQAPRYMVTDGPRDGSGSIKYYSDGYVSRLHPGKIVTGATHNLKEMRDQGIRLERVPDEIVEEGEAQATA